MEEDLEREVADLAVERGAYASDIARAQNGIGESQLGGFQAALCDGSVRFIDMFIDPDVLKALISMDGGEQVPFDY